MTTTLLQGMRVLDLTNVLAGPFAAYQLARQPRISTTWHRKERRSGAHLDPPER